MVDATEKDQNQVITLLLILVAICAGVVLHLLSGVLIPLAVALFLSYIAMPVVRWGRKMHLPVVVSLIVVLLAFSVILGGIGRVAYSSGAEFVDALPGIIEDSRELLESSMTSFGLEEEKIREILPEKGPIDIQKLMSHIPGVRTFARSGVDAVFTGVSFAVLVLLFMVFIVLDRGHRFLDRRIVAAFSREGTNSAEPILKEIHEKIERYIITKTGLSILSGTLVTVTCMIFGVPYAGLIGVMTSLLNFIPNVGPIIAAIPPILLALVTLPTVLHAVPVIICLIVIPFCVGNILEPVIIGKQLRINPITVLVTLVLWGVLWGIWGMVLAVPITAVIKIILEHSAAGHSLATLMDGD